MLRYAESERDTSLVICDIGHGCIVSDTIAICNGHKNKNMLLNDMICIVHMAKEFFLCIVERQLTVCCHH